MSKGFYHQTLGYWQTISDPSDEVLASYPDGTIEVPLRPTPGHTFNGTSWDSPAQEWLDETAANMVRSKRDMLLQQIDNIVMNPLRWNEFTDEKKKEYADYRKALLDITTQSGFPHAVVWPKEIT